VTLHKPNPPPRPFPPLCHLLSALPPSIKDLSAFSEKTQETAPSTPRWGDGPASGSVNASLLAVVEDVRAGACRGVRACGAALNTSLPSAAVLLDAVLHLEVRCSDFDNLQESIESVQIGLRELHSREEPRGEFDAGPWPGCFRACGARRTVLDGYDAVQDVCWDARGRVCARKLVTHTWDPAEETRWRFLQRLHNHDVLDLPLRLRATGATPPPRPASLVLTGRGCLPLSPMRLVYGVTLQDSLVYGVTLQD